jgi:polysaccharide pyruvyl transferase WcaK-like protein
MGHLFFLVGNAPYSNRGCEAIVRGTMRILRREFGDDTQAIVASFGSSNEISRQSAQETDCGIKHVRLELPLRFSAGWWLRQIDKALGTGFARNCRVVNRYAAVADATLQIGGDNYTLDYGYPVAFMEIDRLVWAKNKPLVLWGASVGPFDSDPRFREQIAAHLKNFDAILIREGRSKEVLREIGVEENVSRMPDPAFVMEAIEPDAEKLGFDLPEGSVGINLSPLMAKYTTAGDLHRWAEIGAKIVSTIRRTLDRPIILVPHVTSLDPTKDDGALLRKIAALLPPSERSNVYFVGDNLSAAETKWLISKCALFAGARTHSTIAAISSAVPTLCFAYSAKARGISEAMYGSLNYCIEPEVLTPEAVSSAMACLDAEAAVIKSHLQAKLPRLFEECFAAARVLKRVILHGS